MTPDDPRIPNSENPFLTDTQHILNMTHTPFLVVDLNLDTLWANHKFYEVFHLSPDQLIGHKLFSAANNTWDIPALRRLIDKSLESRSKSLESIEIDTSAPKLGDRALRINAQISFLHSLGKEVLLLSIEDETEKKLREKQVHEFEHRFQRMFETSHDGLMLINKKTGIITDVNPALTGMMGGKKEDFCGKPIQEVGIVDRECDLATLTANLGAIGYYTLDNILINLKTSIPFTAEISFVNKSSSIQCNIRDISDRIADKDLLQLDFNELQSMFKAIPDLIMILDKEMRILKYNTAFSQVFKGTSTQILGHQCHDIFCGRQTPCADCPMLDTLKDLKVHATISTRNALGKTFQIATAPILSESGDLVSIVHIAKDITVQEKLAIQLRQAQKMEAIGSLAGGIAHDFNNILTPILGYTEIAIENTPAGSEILDDLHQVLSSAHRAKELVKQILAFSRHSEEELKPMKIHQVIEEAIKMLRSSLPASIDIVKSIDHTCGAIMADPTQVHQILMNLCTNASQAMHKAGGTLGISLIGVQLDSLDLDHKFNLKPGPYVLLEVSDTGAGIPTDKIHHIFDPYFTTKPKGESTGLGLAVVHGIVKKYNGDITVYSELEKGSVFRVFIPAIPPVSKHKEPHPSPAFLPRGTEHILLIDDEKMIVRMEEQMLRGQGYSVTTFSDSEEALKAFQTHPHDFDLIITDMTMPKLCGDKLAQEMLSIRPDMPIILCSGFNPIVSGTKRQTLGIRKYLTKPIIKSELVIAVRQVLDTEEGSKKPS